MNEHRLENLTENDVAVMLYGALRQIILEQDYFHTSYQIEYSRLTGDGERAIINLVNMWGPRLIKAIHDDDVERGKELIMQELKKGN
jgi:hypothetical protein